MNEEKNALRAHTKMHYILQTFRRGLLRLVRRPVLAVTGEDVAAFCDALIRDNTLWPDRLRRRLNRRVNKRLWGTAE